MRGGGAGSRTRVRKCSAQATTCVSGDLVFVSEVAHRRGVSELILLIVDAVPEGVARQPSPLNGRSPGPRAAPWFTVPSAV